MSSRSLPDAQLAAAITRASSRQTDLTIRYLVDRGRMDDAYRAYGYFRWVDDWLDNENRPRPERLSFVARQKALIDACYRRAAPADLLPEEIILANLVAGDSSSHSGLHTYIRDMLAVMEFDALRRGRLVTAAELDEYTRLLATAVTEAMHYFIGHDKRSPEGASRYQAVTGAHITHMLRDTLEDVEAGYYNIPAEVVVHNRLAAWDVSAPAYRAWVKERVQQARQCFKAGREYLAQVECLRCRLAGFAYTYRFEVVLNSIEREGYILRRQYPERKKAGQAVEMLFQAAWMALKYRSLPAGSSFLTSR